MFAQKWGAEFGVAFNMCIWVGCAPSASVESTGAEASALYGNLSMLGCTDEEEPILVEGHRVGKVIAPTQEFGACLSRRMEHLYKPCFEDDGSDPFATATASQQLIKALSIMRGTNTAVVVVRCAEIDSNGSANIGSYGDDHESIRVSHDFLTNAAAPNFNDFARADVGGLIWHEAMHQQGYRHSDDEDPDDEHCGYAEADYSRGSNSVPYMADRCMRSAGIHSRVVMWNDDDQGQSFVVGAHRASEGDLDGVGDDSIARMVLGPATRVRYCQDEGFDSNGTTCQIVENRTTEYSGLLTPASAYLEAISFVEVEPLVLAFRESYYEGTVQAFDRGEHRGSSGALGIVGHEQIASIFIPAGMRVRACEHEDGVAGHGAGICSYLLTSTADVGALAGKISYLEVVPVVTAYVESDFYGFRENYEPGLYLARDGGLGAIADNRIRSLVVPPWLTVRACSNFNAAGQARGRCRTFTDSTVDLAQDPGLVGDVSYLRVTPMLSGTVSLTVQSPVSGGRVVSKPHAIECGATCTGEFHARSQVRLLAIPNDEDDKAVWTGCDQAGAAACFVTLTGSRTVSVRFEPIIDSLCYEVCLDRCREDAPMSICVPQCEGECS